MTDANRPAGVNDEQQTPAQPSLIQQRMRLDRELVWGLWTSCVGALFGALQLTNLLFKDSPSVFAWLALIGWAGITAAGVVSFRKARRARARFKAEHGKAAGRQQSLR